jgi:copper homeostasis protein CutC
MTPAGRTVLEIICCSLQDAQAARDGGADRLELCANLEWQGLTPPLGLVSQILQEVAVPMRVMIRVNDRFTATDDELSMMERQVTALASLPIDGLIFGLHDAAGSLDFTAMDRVLHHAPEHWGWTLHRAFDFAAGNAIAKLTAVARHGRADRIHRRRRVECRELARLFALAVPRVSLWTSRTHRSPSASARRRRAGP